jgi:FkbM family methyltransferase
MTFSTPGEFGFEDHMISDNLWPDPDIPISINVGDFYMNQECKNSKSLDIQLNELLDESLDSVIDRERTTFDHLVCPFGDRMVLFGAGNLGRKTLSGLRTQGIEPLAFVDNNRQLWNTITDGIQILSPQEAAKKFKDSASFVTTIWNGIIGNRQEVRQKQLYDLGCKTVIPFGFLFWKYPDIFLPHASLDSPHKLYQHSGELREVFTLWADDNSRKEYLDQLRFRMLMDFNGLSSPVTHEQYFPEDLFSILPGEVFIDCGAFDGDTIRELLQHQGDIERILAFEPDTINFSKLQEYISTLPNQSKEKILLRQDVIGKCGQKVRFSTTGTISSKVSEIGDKEFDCVCLDHAVIDCKPTYIKMDIEGSEINALYGALKVIQQNLPILAICVYHLPDDLWKVPSLIKSISGDYHFFLRQY